MKCGSVACLDYAKHERGWDVLRSLRKTVPSSSGQATDRATKPWSASMTAIQPSGVIPKLRMCYKKMKLSSAHLHRHETRPSRAPTYSECVVCHCARRKDSIILRQGDGWWLYGRGSCIRRRKTCIQYCRSRPHLATSRGHDTYGTYVPQSGQQVRYVRHTGAPSRRTAPQAVGRVTPPQGCGDEISPHSAHPARRGPGGCVATPAPAARRVAHSAALV